MGAHPADVRRAGHRRRLNIRPATLYICVDLAVLALSSTLAVAAGPNATLGAYAWGAVFVATCLVVLWKRGFYDFRLGESVVSLTARIITATALAAMLLICARAFIVGEVRVGLLGARLWLYSTVFLSAARTGISLEGRRLWTHTLAAQPAIVVGAGRVGRLVARRLRDRPELGLHPIGHVDDRPRAGSDDDLPVLGATKDLAGLIAVHQVSHVIITFSLAPDAEMRDVMRSCTELGTQVLVIPRLYEEMTRRLTIEHVGGIPLIRVEQPDPRGWQFAIKYALDRIVASLALLVLAPVFVIIAVAVRLSSSGPIFFRQERTGRDARSFTMLKFRSMRGEPDNVGEADAKWAAAIRGERRDDALALVDRTTRVGRVLRKTSLDELPQLVNVLRGEMSLVGPRPERVGYARDFEQLVYRYEDRYRVKSGITGWAQVQKLRGDTSLSDRVEWDNFYIENWSLWLDLRIILMTVPATLMHARRREPRSEPPPPTNGLVLH